MHSYGSVVKIREYVVELCVVRERYLKLSGGLIVACFSNQIPSLHYSLLSDSHA